MQKKLVVVADDFTGANDTGVQFAKAGLKVNVIINTSAIAEEMGQCDVVVIDLESRLISAEEAYNRSFSVGQQLSNIDNCVVYKKLDSTFRGNIGAEIDGLMDAMQLKFTLLAPALPSNGRTVENGEVYVHGVKLADTEFSKDPRNPVKHSKIANIIAIQSKRSCCEIDTDFFNHEQDQQTEFLLNEINGGSEIFIFDSSNDANLEKIASLIERMNYGSFLLAGSSGFANHLHKLSLLQQKRLAFVFAGSASEKTRSQIMYSLDKGNCQLIFIESETLLNDKLDIEKITATICSGISKGINRFIFTSALTQQDVEKTFQIGEQHMLKREEVAGKISSNMGQLAAALIKKFDPTGVLLTGGETAINTVNALGATGIEINQEVLPGVPSGTLTGCSIKSVIVTKAGGFGEVDAISKIFHFFKV